MNWLLIAVICIVAWNVVRGYTRGVLRRVYSLAAWIVMLAASTMAAPYVRDHILSQTGIEPVILNGIEKQIAIQGQKATGDFDMANILLQQSGAYDTISAQLTNAIMTGLSFFIVIFLLGIVACIVSRVKKPATMRYAICGELRESFIIGLMFLIRLRRLGNVFGIRNMPEKY